jgi:hypothetical protein
MEAGHRTSEVEADTSTSVNILSNVSIAVIESTLVSSDWCTYDPPLSSSGCMTSAKGK